MIERLSANDRLKPRAKRSSFPASNRDVKTRTVLRREGWMSAALLISTKLEFQKRHELLTAVHVALNHTTLRGRARV